jgi:hypothetical protein
MMGVRVGFYEHGNEPTDSIKGGEFLDQLYDYQLLNMALYSKELLIRVPFEKFVDW